MYYHTVVVPDIYIYVCENRTVSSTDVVGIYPIPTFYIYYDCRDALLLLWWVCCVRLTPMGALARSPEGKTNKQTNKQTTRPV